MRSKKRNVQLGILVSAAVAALVLFSPPAHADLDLSLEPDISASAGSAGNTFDVLLTNTGASSETVAGFSFGITTSDTDITFTGADTSTVTPYIFAGDSFDDFNDFTLYTNTLPSQTLEAIDFSNSGTGESIASGATLGLGSILFDVASGATPGPFPVTFEDFPTTSLSDPNGANLDFTAEAGTITITTPNPIPEPATGDLMLCALVLAGFASLLRHYRTAVR